MFELPTVLAYPLFYKLVVPEESLVRRAAVAGWVRGAGLLTLDPPARMMEVLAREGASAVTQVPRRAPPLTPPSTARSPPGGFVADAYRNILHES